VTALDAGDSAAAAASFAVFLAKYPRDTRVEDAAYLRIIALQRAGDSDNLKRAAAQYLRKYPRGFRRAEVESLAR
jgi:TolA-binding protein